jgi:hypothetical protein
MRNAVTVTQRFPSWAAAYDARQRLSENDGFDQHGIERIEIERFGGRFELLVRTDQFHQAEVEHLLRSAGTVINPPATGRVERQRSTVPLLLAGGATLAAVALVAGLWPRGERRPKANGGSPPQAMNPTAGVAPHLTPMYTLEIEGTPVAVTKGNEGEARAIFDGQEFKTKLRGMTSDGRPLWTGAGGFRIRPATGPEIRAFVQYAEALGFEDEEEGDIILYVQPIDSPDEFDETQDG